MAEINSANTVVGYFESHSEAEAAIAALESAGFQAHEVGVAAHAGGFKGSDASSAREGASTSGEGTGLWDKVRNFFDGNVAEPYAGERTSGEGATQVITDETAGRGTYSAGTESNGYEQYGADDFHGSLSGLDVSPEHSRYFGDKLRNGGAVVTVSAGNRREEAIEILEDNGADVGEGAEDYAANYKQPVAATSDKVEGDRNLQLYGEVLRVQKDRVSRGDVRLRKEVITETQTVQVPVTREELVVERVAVDGKQAAPNANFGGESEIRIPLSEERARVEKQAVVNEEVRVGKRQVSSVESFDESVRHEELKIEDESKSRAS
ncbi:MAG TPA: YsnF/AvaK domain-containing protein [Acidisarcina sp.]